MIYTKVLDTITFDDVLEFCQALERENAHLDYKRQLEPTIDKTIAAMANSWGGVILIGVEEVDSRPRLPVMGMAFEEHIPERLNNIILGNIEPPILVQVAVPRSPDGTRAFVILRIPQSNTGPHAIRRNTRVYIRTATGNVPEELATLDRIRWLAERRKRSVELREMFYLRAAERWDTHLRRREVAARQGDLLLAACPLYPFEAIVDPRALRRDIPEQIAVQGWNGLVFPPDAIRGRLDAVQAGAAGFHHHVDNDDVQYAELNHYGYFCYRRDIVDSGLGPEGRPFHRLALNSILIFLDLFIEACEAFYRRIGYWGPVELQVAIRKLDEVEFMDLPPGVGFVRHDNPRRRPIDNVLDFERVEPAHTLGAERPRIVSMMMAEIAWAAGFPHSDQDLVLRLLGDAHRR